MQTGRIRTNTVRSAQRTSREPTRIVRGLAFLALLGLLVTVAGAFEWRRSAAAKGLEEILPAETPEALSDEEWAALGGNWKSWSAGVAAEVTRLYESEGASIAEQRKLIASLKRKLNVMERALADERYQSIFDPLASLHGRLERRVAIAEAVLDTLELDPKAVKAARLRSAARSIAAAVGHLEADLKKIPGGSAWLTYVRADTLRKLSAGGTAALPVIEKVSRRLKATGGLKPAQRTFLARPSFRRLAGTIDAYVAASKRSYRAADVKKLRPVLADLVEAIEDYETDFQSTAADRMTVALQAIGRLVPDGGERIRGVVKSEYHLDNFRVVASEKFLDRLVHNVHDEKGEVVDFILGADVSGKQTTHTVTGIDLKPDNHGIRLDLVVSGRTRSDTAGVTSQATIYTHGDHTFRVRKPIIFDGDRFAPRPGTISVDPNNYTVGASTGVSWIPLLGGLADSYAMGQARAKQSESEAIAADRVRKRVLPEVNKQVDKKFKDANEHLHDGFYKNLKKLDLFPTSRSYRSTATQMYLTSLIAGKKELGSDTPVMTVPVGNGLVIQTHASVLNNGVNRIGLAGKTLTDDQVKQTLENFFSTFLGYKVKLDPKGGKKKAAKAKTAKGPNVMVFDARDPVRFRIDNGVVNLILRAGFKQTGKEDVPEQEITVPLILRIEGDQIILKRGNVKVAPVSRPKSTSKQIATAGAIRKKIQSAIQDQTMNRVVMVKRHSEKDFPVTVTDIKAIDGWLIIRVE